MLASVHQRPMKPHSVGRIEGTTKEPIVEIVRWRGLDGITDDQMTEAVAGIEPDLKTLPGFVSQTLHKDDDGHWVALYEWQERAQGEASIALMGPKDTFARLMALVLPESIQIEFLSHP